MPRSGFAPTVSAIPGAVYSPFADRVPESGLPAVPLHVGDTWLPPCPGTRMQDLASADHPDMHRYGPTAGVPALIDAVRAGEARIRRGEHFTNRIHRDDAAGILERLVLADAPRHTCYLAVDDDPADEAEVLRYLAERLAVPEPPLAESESERAPRAGSKRCKNARIKADGYSFEYPSFREGYAAMLA